MTSPTDATLLHARLRKLADKALVPDIPTEVRELVREAADEIERLREAREIPTVRPTDDELRTDAAYRMATSYTHRNGVDPLAVGVLRLFEERQKDWADIDRFRGMARQYMDERDMLRAVLEAAENANEVFGWGKGDDEWARLSEALAAYRERYPKEGT